MNAPLKSTAPVLTPTKGTSPASGDSGLYLPSGVILATILKALRDAESQEIEIQREQAKAEQDFYKALGGLNGNISQGIIAMAAQSVINAGDDEAKGLTAQGIANAVNAGISGTMTVGTLGLGGYNSYMSSKLDPEIEQTKAFGEKLEGPKDADIVVAQGKSPTDAELEELMDRGGLKADGKYDQEAIEAIKAEPETLSRAKAKNNEKLEDLEKKQKEYAESTNNWTFRNQAIGNVTQSATSAAASIRQAQTKTDQAIDNASAQVQKQVQDMNSSSAQSFHQNAKEAAQQALTTADSLAQVAQAQVQFRG